LGGKIMIEEGKEERREREGGGKEPYPPTEWVAHNLRVGQATKKEPVRAIAAWLFFLF
jgi:hypothetical protein